MMAVTDIIGFSFFIILPDCLPDLLSLVTVDRFILPTFSHTRTPPPPVAHHHLAVRPSRFFSDGTLAPSAPRHFARKNSCLPPCPSLPRSRAKLLLLVSIWYGCSLHFFGSFVIDRATGCLTILQQKEKSGFQEQEGITTYAGQRKNPSPNRTATLNPTAFTDK